MAETYSLRTRASCTATGGVLSCTMDYELTGGGAGSAEGPTMLYLLAGTIELDSRGGSRGGTVEFTGLADMGYTIEWRDTDSQDVLARGGSSIACGSGGGGADVLTLDSLTHTDETAALNDGTATIQATGGVAPLTAEVVELSLSQPATSGQPTTFPALPPAGYTVRVRDSSTPTPRVVGGTVTIKAYAAPVTGCQDEYADNYDPAATSGGAASCTYTPVWRSAWGPSGVAVPVPALPGQVKAYTEANLYIGFRPGHPLAAERPLGLPLPLRATVGPSGFAVFRLGPYLRSTLGAADGEARRLDLNSGTAFTADLYVGYELRRTTGELLQHGYALNAAVPDEQLLGILSPFPVLPVWPGYDRYIVSTRSNRAGGYGIVNTEGPDGIGDLLYFPCPSNPLPVAWLAPGGGYGYWVFSGRHQLSDDVGEGQAFTEASSGEQRWSQRGVTRGTIAASSGVFNGPQFAEGLRTLWASPQVWVQLVAGGEWVPVTLAGGSFPVRRMGLPRTEVSITMTVARPAYVQGQ